MTDLAKIEARIVELCESGEITMTPGAENVLFCTSELVGISASEAWDVEMGFDNPDSDLNEGRPFRQLGARLARRFVDGVG